MVNIQVNRIALLLLGAKVACEQGLWRVGDWRYPGVLPVTEHSDEGGAGNSDVGAR